LVATPSFLGADVSIPSNSAHSAATPSFTRTDVPISTWIRTRSPGQHTWSPRPASSELTIPSRATQHTPPPHLASPELTFPFRHGAALVRRASTLGRHAPFLLLTEFLAGEWRYSATHLSGISDAEHACVVLCFQLPSRSSSASRLARVISIRRHAQPKPSRESAEPCSESASFREFRDRGIALSAREADEQREGS